MTLTTMHNTLNTRSRESRALPLLAYGFMLLFVGAGLATSIPAQAAEAEPTTTLQDISVTTLSGNRVQLKLRMDSAPPPPISFTIDNPARIVLDFPHTTHTLSKNSQPIDVGLAKSINIAEAKGRTRVVLNMVRLSTYETRIEGNDVYLTLEAAPAAAQAQASTAATSGKPAPTTATNTGGARHAITNIDFRRGEKGEGRILITLSDPSTGVDLREEGGKILVDFLNSSVPENLQRRLDVVDFATPVQTIDTAAQGNNVRMTITPLGAYEHLAYQAGDIYTVEVKPLTKEQQDVAKKEKGYTGEKLSLNFQNIEVRAVLQLIADFTGLNLVTSDTVQGNLTLRLKNVPWDQALDIILRTKGLAMRQHGNVLLIAPSEEIAAREKLELESQKQVAELAPLRSEFISVNFAKASDLAALLKATENSLLSPRGNVAVDERTNTLLIQDVSDKLAEIRKLVATLDIPQRQVLIESRVVIADDNFSKDLGVKFGIGRTSNPAAQSGYQSVISGTLPTTRRSTTSTTTDTVSTVPGASNTVSTSVLSGALAGGSPLNVNLPITGAPSIALAIARLPYGILLDLELSALQKEKRGEVISNPRVVTANQKEARIEQGEEIPYLEASSSGATTVTFKKAVLSLTVKPQITPDNHIIMDLTVNKDSRGELVVLAGSTVPAINTKQVSTQVLVDNGETIVLGGVYEQTISKDTQRVPFLGDLPYIGFLFRQELNTNDKNELLIFVTPKILEDNLRL
ncbi:MAG: type IV pilus secretin PilQ [Gammaproteobacteria bacterium]|nr:type IV pilus secretin PilQ [Gammaproteobacteria bacterium]